LVVVPYFKKFNKFVISKLQKYIILKYIEKFNNTFFTSEVTIQKFETYFGNRLVIEITFAVYNRDGEFG